jgi:hypothetical protein
MAAGSRSARAAISQRAYRFLEPAFRGNDFRRSRAFSFLIAYVLDRLCRSMCHP